MLEFISERGWTILNDGIKEDKEEEWTYTRGRGESVIDYILSDEIVKEKIIRLDVGKNVKLDHHPI